MKGIFDALKNVFEQFGIDTLYIFVGILILAVIQPIWKSIEWLILRRNQKLLNKNLSPFFSTRDVDKATSYYIPTKFQNVSPEEDDELGKSYIASAKQEIIPLFLRKVFKSDADDNKYYLILADSGMGKTTLMINLFLRYKNQLKIPFAVKYNIVLFPLGSPEALEEVKKVEDKKNTILLLDAFDEDIKAVEDHKTRLAEILEYGKNFREVVITCRTQFFPSEEEEPTKAGYIKTYGDGETEYKFQKLYLSVFDDDDINRYLKKRYSIFDVGKPRKAKEIVRKSPNLVMRPLLLTYVNDFVDEEKSFNYSFEVYKVLIDKWITRESNKHGVREKYGSREYKKILYDFSEELASNLYKNREKRGGYFFPKGEALASVLQISEVESYTIHEQELKGKSLLNRNAQGQYKFAHKSIFEYFLAKKCYEDSYFLDNFKFEGMRAAKIFFDEMLIEDLNRLNAKFSIQSSHARISLLELTEIKKVRSLKINKLEDFSLFNLSILENLSQLVIVANKECESLYDLYILVFYKLLAETKNLGWLDVTDRIEFLKLINVINSQGLVQKIQSLGLLELKERIEHFSSLDLNEMTHLLRTLNKNERKEQSERVGLLNGFVKMTNVKNNLLLKQFSPINNYLKEVQRLQEKIPNCKIYY